MFRPLAALSLPCLAALVLAAVPAALVLAAVPAAAAPQYTRQDLGPFASGEVSGARLINAAGEVAGTAGSPQGAGHTFFWSAGGGAVGVPAPPGVSTSSNAYPIALNASGQILEQAQVSAFVLHAFLWTPAANRRSGALVDLGTLGATGARDEGTTTTGLNDQGQVVGTAYAADGTAHGFLWTPGGTGGVPSNPRMKDLGGFTPGGINNRGVAAGVRNRDLTLYDGQAFYDLGGPFPPSPFNAFQTFTVRGINAGGEVAGVYSDGSGFASQFLWVPNAPGGKTGTFVLGDGTLGTSFLSDFPAILNGPGQVAGELEVVPLSRQSLEFHAGLWSLNPDGLSATLRDLGGLVASGFGNVTSTTEGLNGLGQVVGNSAVYLPYPSVYGHGFVYRDGLMYDLDLHLTAPLSGGEALTDAAGINDAGQIAATVAGEDGTTRAVLLTPSGTTPDPPPALQYLYLPGGAQALVVNYGPDFDLAAGGSAFTAGSVVRLNGTPVSATVYAESLIRVRLKSSEQTPGVKQVTVSNPDGSLSNALSFTVAGGFPIPTLATASPERVPAGSPDTPVTLTGTGLFPQTQVGLTNGQSLTTLSASADHSRLTVLVPAALLASGTNLTFYYASNPNEAGQPPAKANAATLTVVNPVPTITSLSPPTLPADSVSSFALTVHGTHFVPGSQITWNGEYFPTNYVSPTLVTAYVDGYNLNYPGPDTVPPGPLTVQVINAAPGGGTASATQTILNGPYPAPTLTGLYPGVIAPGVPAYVFLTGTHFLHHSVIHVGSQAFPLDNVSNRGSLSADRTQIGFYLPPSAVPTAGVFPVFVVNPGPGGGTTAPMNLVVQAASLHASAAALSRDMATGQIVAQVTLTAGSGADATGVSVTGATLGVGGTLTALPLTAGTIPSGTSVVVTLRFPASAAAPGATATLRVSGQYAGGSFVSSRRVVAP